MADRNKRMLDRSQPQLSSSNASTLVNRCYSTQELRRGNKKSQSSPVQPSELLLAFASTVILGLGFRYFCPFERFDKGRQMGV
jgi:hypothetical protein